MGQAHFHVAQPSLILQSPGVSKLVLGRGLGDLLKGRKPVATPEERGHPETVPDSETPGPGLEKLLQGNAAEDSAPRRVGLVQWSLVGADVVLLILSARMVFGRSTPLSVADIILCLLAVGLGAWLSCLALLSLRKR